jgi:hypothetical protein
MVPVIGFPVTIPEMGGKILFIGVTLGIASFISSFFLGIMFGVPKRNNKEKTIIRSIMAWSKSRIG